jgi:hypothetical protein
LGAGLFNDDDDAKEMTMFTKMVYRGLPPSMLMTVTAFLQYYAIRAFA